MHGIRFDVKLPIKIEKGEKFYIASCPVLDVISQGKTLKKAKSNLHEALSLFLISCFERGVLDAVLKNCGFKSAVKPPPQRRSAITKEEYINIPLHFLANKSEPRRCHA
jgi:predicted RNase H-like HicB family nuclease